MRRYEYGIPEHVSCRPLYRAPWTHIPYHMITHTAAAGLVRVADTYVQISWTPSPIKIHRVVSATVGLASTDAVKHYTGWRWLATTS